VADLDARAGGAFQALTGDSWPPWQLTSAPQSWPAPGLQRDLGDAADGRQASPRKPSVAMRKRSSAVLSLLVA